MSEKAMIKHFEKNKAIFIELKDDISKHHGLDEISYYKNQGEGAYDLAKYFSGEFNVESISEFKGEYIGSDDNRDRIYESNYTRDNFKKYEEKYKISFEEYDKLINKLKAIKCFSVGKGGIWKDNGTTKRYPCIEFVLVDGGVLGSVSGIIYYKGSYIPETRDQGGIYYYFDKIKIEDNWYVFSR